MDAIVRTKLDGIQMGAHGKYSFEIKKNHQNRFT